MHQLQKTMTTLHRFSSFELVDLQASHSRETVEVASKHFLVSLMQA
jgi:hypothetical protein